MADDPKDHDLLRLNALVDGELAPTERADVAARLAVNRDLARAYATLARLKASVAEGVAETPAFVLPKHRRYTIRRVAAAAASLAAVIGLGLWALDTHNAKRGDTVVSAEGPTAITLASLPAGTNIPRLDTAGLKLVGLTIGPGRVPLVTATYRGPHGCRLDLRAWPAGTAEAPPLPGTASARWTAGGLTYELIAHGMPKWRFALIAEGAKEQTRSGTDPLRAEQRLRQANNGPPPCVG